MTHIFYKVPCCGNRLNNIRQKICNNKLPHFYFMSNNKHGWNHIKFWQLHRMNLHCLIIHKIVLLCDNMRAIRLHVISLSFNLICCWYNIIKNIDICMMIITKSLVWAFSCSYFYQHLNRKNQVIPFLCSFVIFTSCEYVSMNNYIWNMMLKQKMCFLIYWTMHNMKRWSI